jgi:hypothetical protein
MKVDSEGMRPQIADVAESEEEGILIGEICAILG